MDSDTRQEMDEIKASQLRTNQNLEQLTEITVNLATTVNGLASKVDNIVTEQRAATKSLEAGQKQLNAIVNKMLDNQA